MSYTRKYFFEVTDDRQSIVIGTNWNPETNKLNQIGLITKNNLCSAFIDFQFKFENGQNIDLKRVLVTEALTSVVEYFSKDDYIALCEMLYLWG